tara:strand:+ start:188 stop:385 length:198 start_codon:yes stop_codon:yes gene_type:complete
MLRAGNRVSLFFNMGKKGTILSLHEVKNNTWMVGGAASPSLMARVQFDDGELVEYPVSELMLIDD